jgi:Flp pilus assembly pilin Flp
VSKTLSRLIGGGYSSREAGQALVEYALVLTCVALVTVTALQTIGVGVLDHLSDAAAGLGGA